MRKALTLTAIAAACALFASSLTASDELPADLEGYSITGETENCLSLHQIYESDALDDYNIVFEMRNGSKFLSRLPHRCAGLSFRGFSYSTSLSQLCNTDIITVLDTSTGVNGPSCGLGMFEELAEADIEE